MVGQIYWEDQAHSANEMIQMQDCSSVRAWLLVLEGDFYCKCSKNKDSLKPVECPRKEGNGLTWTDTVTLVWGCVLANNYLSSACLCFSVLVTHSDTVKISDFGTSKELSDKSTKMSFAGTVAWMAPEVIRNEPVSEKVDIW